ncbi:MAG TPA: hypothetical protein VHS06_11645, partial [Chloroflexota bacterium]|nr:hypothetical protein [Chloroflexota bacterium]
MAIWLLTLELTTASLLMFAVTSITRQKRRPADRLLAASIISLISILVPLAIPLAITLMLW